MHSDQPRRAFDPSHACAFALVVLMALATRAIWWGDPVADFDEQLYSFIGWRMTHGELPYVDWWDRKPFGLFALFGIAHAIGGPGPLAYQVLSFAFALAGAGFVFLIGRRLASVWTAAIAASLSLVLLAAYASYSGQSEGFFVPLAAAMVWLLADPHHPSARRRALLAMLLGGIALQVKYTVLPQCVLLGGWALWQEWRRSTSIRALVWRAFLFAGAGLLPSVLVGLFYAVGGHWDAFWFANFVSFFDRMPAPQGRWASEHALGVAPLAMLALFGIYAAIRFVPPRDRQVYALVCAWTLSSLATVLLPGTVYLYYYAAMAAPIALLALPLYDTGGPYRAWPGAALLLALGLMLSLPERRAESLEERSVAQAMARDIGPFVGADKCLWLYDGPAALYRMTGSCVPTRFVYPDHLNNLLERDALGVSQSGEVRRVLSTRPAVIVTADRAMTVLNQDVVAEVRKELDARYVLARTYPMHNRNLKVWIRRAGT